MKPEFLPGLGFVRPAPEPDVHRVWDVAQEARRDPILQREAPPFLSGRYDQGMAQAKRMTARLGFQGRSRAVAALEGGHHAHSSRAPHRGKGASEDHSGDFLPRQASTLSAPTLHIVVM